MMTITLKNYAELRGVSYQTALEESREAEALICEGSKMLVDVEKINKYMETETIEGLIHVNGLEVEL